MFLNGLALIARKTAADRSKAQRPPPGGWRLLVRWWRPMSGPMTSTKRGTIKTTLTSILPSVRWKYDRLRAVLSPPSGRLIVVRRDDLIDHADITTGSHVLQELANDGLVLLSTHVVHLSRSGPQDGGRSWVASE